MTLGPVAKTIAVAESSQNGDTAGVVPALAAAHGAVPCPAVVARDVPIGAWPSWS